MEYFSRNYKFLIILFLILISNIKISSNKNLLTAEYCLEYPTINEIETKDIKKFKQTSVEKPKPVTNKNLKSIDYNSSKCEIIRLIHEIAPKYNIPPLVMIAIADKETNIGTNVKGHNIFCVKATNFPNLPYYTAKDDCGSEHCRFVKYSSYSAAISHWAKYFSPNNTKIYKDCYNCKTELEILKCFGKKYATDRKWYAKIKDDFNSNKQLYKVCLDKQPLVPQLSLPTLQKDSVKLVL